MNPLLEEIRTIDTGRAALRSFGLLVGAVLAAISLVVLWRQGWIVGPAFYTLLAAGAALVILGLLAPLLLTHPYRIWMALAVVMGFLMTRVILALVFFLVVTPIGLLLRLFGRDPLSRKIDPQARTYWIAKEYPDESSARLEKYY